MTYIRGLAQYAILLSYVSLSGGAVRSDELTDAQAAYVRGDYAAAVAFLNRVVGEPCNDALQRFLDETYPTGGPDSSTLNDCEYVAVAQWLLGTMYAEGLGVAANNQEALRLVELAANEGNEDAIRWLFSIGASVVQQPNVTKEATARAVHWIASASNEGIGEAQILLGDLMMGGLLGPHDNSGAAELFHRAARQGNPLGQVKLAFMYSEGLGVPQDAILAHMWFNIGAALAGQNSDVLEEARRGRTQVESSMTPEQIADAQRQAQECISSQFRNCP